MRQSEPPGAAAPEFHAGLQEGVCSLPSRRPSEPWSRAGAGGPSPWVPAGCWQGAVPPVGAGPFTLHPGAPQLSIWPSHPGKE